MSSSGTRSFATWASRSTRRARLRLPGALGPLRRLRRRDERVVRVFSPRRPLQWPSGCGVGGRLGGGGGRSPLEAVVDAVRGLAVVARHVAVTTEREVHSMDECGSGRALERAPRGRGSAVSYRPLAHS